VRFEVRADGSIGDGKIFVDMSLDDPEGHLKDLSPRSGGFVDGMKVDKNGNVFAVGPGGVWALTPEGRHIGTIRAPIARFTNLALGGTMGASCSSLPPRAFTVSNSRHREFDLAAMVDKRNECHGTDILRKCRKTNQGTFYERRTASANRPLRA
jgi:hypothetical protein